MGVSRKAGVGSQGERQSKVVEQFAAGFVASSSATDAEKATQRDWDRSQLLAVNGRSRQKEGESSHPGILSNRWTPVP